MEEKRGGEEYGGTREEGLDGGLSMEQRLEKPGDCCGQNWLKRQQHGSGSGKTILMGLSISWVTFAHRARS